MSSATESSSVQALKDELKSIKAALDAITARPEFSATAYKYGGDPIYLQTSDCPSPFIACDSALMDCPDEKYGQPEMYTSGGQRCYQSGALARQAFLQEKERLQSAAASPATLVGQIRELVKSAAALSSKMQSPEGEKKSRSSGVNTCEAVTEQAFADDKQRQQYCEGLKDDAGNQQCAYNVQTKRCVRKTQAAMAAIAADNRLAESDGLSIKDRILNFVRGGGATKSALDAIHEEEKKNDSAEASATDKLIEESVRTRRGAGLAGVIASMLQNLVENKDENGNLTPTAQKAQELQTWCINHGILVNLVGVGLVAGAAFTMLPAAEVTVLMKAAASAVSGLTQVQGVFLSSALNGMNAVFAAVSQLQLVPMLKELITNSSGKIGLMSATLMTEALKVAKSYTELAAGGPEGEAASSEGAVPAEATAPEDPLWLTIDQYVAYLKISGRFAAEGKKYGLNEEQFETRLRILKQPLPKMSIRDDRDRQWVTSATLERKLEGDEAKEYKKFVKDMKSVQWLIGNSLAASYAAANTIDNEGVGLIKFLGQQFWSGVKEKYVAPAFLSIGAAVAGVSKYVHGKRETARKLFQDMKKSANDTVEKLKAKQGEVVTWLGTTFTTTKEKYTKAVEAFVKGTKERAGAASESLNGVLNNVKQTATGAVESTRSTVVNFAPEFIAKRLRTAEEAAKKAAKETLEKGGDADDAAKAAVDAAARTESAAANAEAGAIAQGQSLEASHRLAEEAAEAAVPAAAAAAAEAAVPAAAAAAAPVKVSQADLAAAMATPIPGEEQEFPEEFAEKFAGGRRRRYARG